MLFDLKDLNIYQINSIQRGVYYSSVKMFSQLTQNVFKFHNNIHTFKTLLHNYLVQNFKTELAMFSLTESFPNKFPLITNIPITKTEVTCTISSLKNKN